MTVNLIKTAVGIQSLEDLKGRVESYMTHDGLAIATTRNMPKRADEIIGGKGSMYWIIKRAIQARMEIIDLIQQTDETGRKFCQIVMKPEIIATRPIPYRHIQGWRYLEVQDSPDDLLINRDDDEVAKMPPKLVKELTDLALI